MTLLDRRQLLIAASAAPFALACPAAALAAAPSVKEEMLRLFGDKIATPGKIRLDVPAIAEMSDGALFSAQVEVKVTLGGCGG